MGTDYYSWAFMLVLVSARKVPQAFSIPFLGGATIGSYLWRATLQTDVFQRTTTTTVAVTPSVVVWCRLHCVHSVRRHQPSRLYVVP